MKHECACGKKTQATELTAISGMHLSRLATSSTERLLATSKAAQAAFKAKSAAFASGGPETVFHVTAAGDALATTYFAENSTGDIVVKGFIAGIPYELHIAVALEGQQVAVTLHLVKPIEIGPYTWRFDLGGVVKDSAGKIISATALVPAAESQALDINWWCAAKCGGLTILPTLVLCLPSLAGGPAAYVACVVAKLGAGDAAKIAACIAKECV